MESLLNLCNFSHVVGYSLKLSKHKWKSESFVEPLGSRIEGTPAPNVETFLIHNPFHFFGQQMSCSSNALLSPFYCHFNLKSSLFCCQPFSPFSSKSLSLSCPACLIKPYSNGLVRQWTGQIGSEIERETFKQIQEDNETKKKTTMEMDRHHKF